MKIALESYSSSGARIVVQECGFEGKAWLVDFEVEFDADSERKFMEKIQDAVQEAKDNMRNQVDKLRKRVQEIDADA